MNDAPRTVGEDMELDPWKYDGYDGMRPGAELPASLRNLDEHCPDHEASDDRELDFGTMDPGDLEPPGVFIENEGALFKGLSRSFPEFLWSEKERRWVPYTGKVHKPIEWGNVITREEFERLAAADWAD